MKALVYVVLDSRGDDTTLFSVEGTQDAALREYRRRTRRPGRIDDTVTDKGGKSLILDRDATGQGVIATFEVDVTETP